MCIRDRNDLDLCLEVVSRSCHPLCYIRRWISRKTLEVEVWFQRTTNKNGIWGIKWSRDRWRHLTPKVRWGSTIGYPSDSLTSCLFLLTQSRTSYNIQRAIVLSEYRQTSIHTFQWLLEYETEKHWNSVAHFRYHGSIEYRDTSDGIVIAAPISGITQHYCTLHKSLSNRLYSPAFRELPRLGQ